MAPRGPARIVRARFERLTGDRVDSWSGLRRLVAEQVPESPELDYKLRPYDDPSKDKQERNDELRKDVTAFANNVGGVIVCGISDRDGLPGQLLGFEGSLDRLEGDLGSVLRSRIWPALDDVEIIPVSDPSSNKGCLLIVVPASPRAPHAVTPHSDSDALKYARRVGRHTEWLSEAQVADLYRARFTAGQSQTDRAEALIEGAKDRLARRDWLIAALVPDSPGDYSVSRARVESAEQWWLRRRRLEVLPGTNPWSATASVGPRRVILSRSDGQTSVPTGLYAELHDDGACAIAVELRQGPSGNPSFFLDELVASVVDLVVSVADFSSGQAGCGGYALLRATLHFPEHPDAEILAYDPSWNPQPQPRSARRCDTTHTIDLDSIVSSNTEACATAALVASHLAQFFGLPDALYLTPAGAVRVQQFQADIRDRQVIPAAGRFGIEIDTRM